MVKELEISDIDGYRDRRDIIVSGAFGQKEVLAGAGEFYFIDDADYFAGEPSAELMSIVEALKSRGVKVVILTSNNPDNLETDALRDQMTSELGLGEYENDTLNPRVIMCIFNNKTTDNAREISCATGDAYQDAISEQDMGIGVDLIIEGIKSGDIDGGFSDAFGYFEQVLENLAVEKEAQQDRDNSPDISVPSVDSQSSYDDPIWQEPTTGAEVQPSFVETNKTGLTHAGLTALVIGTLAGVTAITYPKRKFVKEVRASKRNASASFAKLSSQIGVGLGSFGQIDSSLKASYPEEAEVSREEEKLFNSRWRRVEELKRQLSEASVGFLVGRSSLSDVSDLAMTIKQESNELVGVITEKSREADNLIEREKAAQTNVEAATAKFNQTENWYDDKLEVFRSILPATKLALSAIDALIEESRQNSYYETSLALKGSDQAVEALGFLDEFVVAVEAYTKGYEVSEALLKDSANDLSKWPGQAIDPIQLASSGVKLLDEAKAGILIPSEFGRVVELSQNAEREFKFAKDFSSASATVLNLHDENNDTIKEIISEGFDERHVQEIRNLAESALTKANLSASQGEWGDAQSEIGILRVRTNESLAEMIRLKQLHEKNNDDLVRIATEVGDTQERYDSETQGAWSDLEVNFVSDNFDETTEIWGLLRDNMSPEESEDFRGHFISIGNILKEVTDDSTNKQDIATVATNKNSLDEQEFDEAESLIRNMERRLLEAQKLMNDLLERQKLARKAEEDYGSSIENSKKRLQAAEESIDTHDENRLVDETVDQKINEVRELIDLAEHAGEKLIFVAAFEAASKATNVAIQARQSAEEQIKALQALYLELDSRKTRSLSAVNSVISDVNGEADAVITSSTQGALKSLEQDILKAKDQEKGLASFEDHRLADAINSLLSSYGSIDNSKDGLESDLDSDRRSYQGLLDDLSRAISSANSSISSASSKCNDSDAGYAGDSSLSSARSALPGGASWGDLRSNIKGKISSAKQAESYADTARSQAVAEIRAEERRRAAEERKKRQAEADKRAADQRAQRQKRNEASRKMKSSSNKSSKKF